MRSVSRIYLSVFHLEKGTSIGSTIILSPSEWIGKDQGQQLTFVMIFCISTILTRKRSFELDFRVFDLTK